MIVNLAANHAIFSVDRAVTAGTVRPLISRRLCVLVTSQRGEAREGGRETDTQTDVLR